MVRLVRHLTAGETQAILNAPDPTGQDGLRGCAMLQLCYAEGLRVSELTAVRIDDVKFQPQTNVLVHGKGRRERCLPLWKTTTPSLFGGARHPVGAGIIRQRERRILDPLRRRLHSAQTCSHRDAALPFPGNKARIPTRS
jgi:integrase